MSSQLEDHRVQGGSNIKNQAHIQSLFLFGCEALQLELEHLLNYSDRLDPELWNGSNHLVLDQRNYSRFRDWQLRWNRLGPLDIEPRNGSGYPVVDTWNCSRCLHFEPRTNVQEIATHTLDDSLLLVLRINS